MVSVKRKKRLKRKGRKTGYWKIRKILNPPVSITSRLEWKPLPKEAFSRRK